MNDVLTGGAQSVVSYRCLGELRFQSVADRGFDWDTTSRWRALPSYQEQGGPGGLRTVCRTRACWPQHRLHPLAAQLPAPEPRVAAIKRYSGRSLPALRRLEPDNSIFASSHIFPFFAVLFTLTLCNRFRATPRQDFEHPTFIHPASVRRLLSRPVAVACFMSVLKSQPQQR